MEIRNKSVYPKSCDGFPLKTIYRFLNVHVRTISFLSGSVFISLWALLRFFETGSTYDLLGQQLLTRQWLSGNMSHAVVGTTNYLWKMLIFYAPTDILPGSPRIKLIVLTILINILTFILLVLVLEKLCTEIGIKVSSYFYAGLIWLTLIAGSVFWVQFTNSRNLEVVGGVYLIYLGIKLIHKLTTKLAVGTLLLASILFFSDPIQVYMTAVPLLIYAYVQSYSTKVNIQRPAWLTAILSIAYLASKVITLAATHIFSLQFTRAPGLATITTYSLSSWFHNILDTGKSFIQLYDGGHELGRVVQLLDLLLVGLSIIYFIIWALKKRSLRKVMWLVSIVFVIDAVVYMASGQSYTGGTSRYLIMTVPMLIIIFGAVGTLRLLRVFLALAVFAIFINGLVLTSTTIKAWGTRFTGDQHLVSAVKYLNQQRYPYAYASMDTAIPTSYYYNPRTTVLPLSCFNGVLARAYLFYGKEVFIKAESTPTSLVPIILDGGSIRNYPNTCTKYDVIKQFGNPAGIQSTSYGDEVLLYAPSSTLAALGSR